MANPNIGKVRAKFVVNAIKRHRGSCRGDDGVYAPCEMQTVEMTVNLTDYKPEDNDFASATPSGSCTLSITKPAVVDFFDLGKCFYADFTPAE